MMYKVKFHYEDSFPETVLQTEDLDEALNAAEGFLYPEDWKEDEDDNDASFCMTAEDTEGNILFWCNTEGESGTDCEEDHPLYKKISERLWETAPKT